MDNVVCGVCGSGSRSHLIVKCARCNDYEHCYCMKVLTFAIPPEWHCAKCQEYANGSPKPSQGGKTELQKPWHGNDMTNESEASKHPISPKSPNRFGNSKVKFISSEEAALLSRERPPFVRSRFAVRQPSRVSSRPTTKHLSNSNCGSPSRSDTQVKALKQCADASHSKTKAEDRAYFAMQQRQSHPASPSMKQPSNMKSVPPGRSDMQVHNLKRCAASRHDQANNDESPYFPMRQSQVHPTSPPNKKQLSNMKCISPNRTITQVHAMKRCTGASHDQAKIDDINMDCEARSGASHDQAKIDDINMDCEARYGAIHDQAKIDDINMDCEARSGAIHDQAKIDDINMDCKARSGGSVPITSELFEVKIDSLIEDKAREKKIVNADKGEIYSLIEVDPREKGTLRTSNGDTGYKSEMGSLNPNKGVILNMGSTVKYSRRPAPEICWKGCFHVFDTGDTRAKLNLGEFRAHFPLEVSSRVYNIVKMIPSDLQLELLPRMNDWPKSFETIHPVHEDIGVFFFSNKPDGCEKNHSNLLEAYDNYVLRAYIDGIKLLIYSSEVLPPDSQWIDGKNYLWVIFVRSKGKGYPWRFGSTKTS